jgi:hypothetical protein
LPAAAPTRPNRQRLDWFAAGDVNLNRFVGNAPTTQTDPDGRWAILIRRALKIHVRYTYKNIIGLEPLGLRLIKEVLPHVSVSRNDSIGPTAHYLPFWNDIEYRGPLKFIAPSIAIHETVHALNDFEGRYESDAEKDEALAWGAQAFFEAPTFRGLRDFEDKMGNFTKVEAQKAWDALWDKNSPISIPGHLLGYSLQWGGDAGQSRTLNNEDYLDVRRHLGLSASCSELAKRYSWQIGGLDWCLRCPDDLPSAFK